MQKETFPICLYLQKQKKTTSSNQTELDLKIKLSFIK